MEETLRLPENPDVDVTLTFCDNCNPDWDPGNAMPLSEEWAAILGMEAGQLVLRGVCYGTAAKARSEGWQDREYGHLCAVCVYEERMREGTTLTVAEAQALALLTGQKTGDDVE